MILSIKHNVQRNLELCPGSTDTSGSCWSEEGAEEFISSAPKEEVSAKVSSGDGVCALAPAPALLLSLSFFFGVTLGKLLNPFNSVLGSAFQTELLLFPLRLSR